MTIQEETLSMGGRPDTRRDAVDSARTEVVDALFRRHYVGLLRLAFVMTGEREAAEDAVQDAFVSVHRNWRKLRDPDTAEAYLRSAVLNRCRSWVRRQVTARAPRRLVLVDTEPASPEETTLVREEAGSLVGAMRTLPRRQREVLACRYVLQLSVAETAALLNISEGSVKVHTHRGLRSLQQRMEVTR